MKKRFHFILLVLAAALLFTGCAAGRLSAEEELRRLALLELYTADGQLLRSVDDPDTLREFNRLVSTEIEAQDRQPQLAEPAQADGLCPLYTLVTYKTPAAVYPDGTLEKELELTLYRGSNLVREQIAPSNVRNFPVPEEYLTFYSTASDECIAFVQTLAEG